jgi:hypothetical protein
MSLKWASEELLKLADDIDKEAAKVTQFVCADCNHTATLALINERREKAAKEAGENVVVTSLNVEDKIHCPACEGTMSYKATDESKAYYFDTEKEAQDDETENDDKDEEKKKASEPIDYDSLERYIA